MAKKNDELHEVLNTHRPDNLKTPDYHKESPKKNNVKFNQVLRVFYGSERCSSIFLIYILALLFVVFVLLQKNVINVIEFFIGIFVIVVIAVIIFYTSDLL